jgi:hypothetical protein
MTKHKRLITTLYKLTEDEGASVRERIKAAELLCRVQGFIAPSEPLPSFAGRPSKPETVDEKLSFDLESLRHLLPKEE